MEDLLPKILLTQEAAKRWNALAHDAVLHVVLHGYMVVPEELGDEKAVMEDGRLKIVCPIPIVRDGQRSEVKVELRLDDNDWTWNSAQRVPSNN